MTQKSHMNHATEHVMTELTFADGKVVKEGDVVAHKRRGYLGRVTGIVVRAQYSPLIRVEPLEEDMDKAHSYPTEDGGVCMPCRDIGKPRGRWVFL